MTLLQLVMKLFTVGDKTCICIHRTAPVSFVTDCNSVFTNCKSFVTDCKNLTVDDETFTVSDAILLTITMGA